jgi:uncharacterized protein (DUF58 family)
VGKRFTLSEAWLWICVLLLAAGFALRASSVIALAAVLLPIYFISWLWNRFSLRDVEYSRKLQYRRAFPGEEVECEVTIENGKLIPLAWLRVRDRWPRAVAPVDERLTIPTHTLEEVQLNLVMVLRGLARIRRKMKLIFRQRGHYTIGPTIMNSGDPFGLFHSETTIKRREHVVVFPELRPLEDLGLRAEDPFGERRAPKRLFDDPSLPIGVRDHQAEDGFRRIHWPATARVGRLQSRVYQPVSGNDCIVCLNVTTLEHHWMGVVPDLFEELVRVSAALVYESFNQRYRVGLISNGTVAHGGQPFRIPPGRSPKHLPRLLEALASASPIVTAPFAQFLLTQAPYIEYGSTLLVVTGVTPPELAEALVRLRARTRRTALFSLAEDPPPFIPRVQTIHRPFSFDEAR